MANIIITNLSKPNDKSKEDEYISEIDNIKVKGKNTNDAPVKYLIRHIADKGKSVDKIIAVTTPEAEKTLKAIKETLKIFSDEENIHFPEIEKIDAEEGKFTETINDITEKFNPGDCAYIDTTGGFRNSSYILMCVVRILEYSGIKLKKAVYSFWDTKKISDVTHVYGMYDLINAVDAFTNYGNSYGLEQYFRKTEEPVVKEVIGAMNEFSENISLCRTSGLADILNRLNTSLEKLSETQSESAGIILFKSLIDTIRDKFYMKGKTIEYPDIIRWCLDNRLIQQAVTIYVERMPEFFLSKGYFIVTEEKRKELEIEGKKKNYDINYWLFYNGFLGKDKKGSKNNEFQELLKKVINDYSEGIDSSLYNKLVNEKNADIILNDIKIDIIDKPLFKKTLNQFLKLRDMLYDKNGKRRKQPLFNKQSGDSSELEEYIYSHPNLLSQTTEKFLRSVSSNKPLFDLLSGEKETEEEKSKLELVDALSIGYIRNGFSLGKVVSVEKMQKILRDILYAKNYIRNKMNHASVDTSVKDQEQEYFSSHGYNVEREMNLSDIKEFMLKAIENLKF